MSEPEPLEERRIGAVTVLFGSGGGKYPSGNTLLVQGREECVIIDPSLDVIPRHKALPRIDRILASHCHEDHIAGNFLFPEARCHLHEEDLPGIQSLEALLKIYGYSEATLKEFSKVLVDTFHFEPRPESVGFRDGDVFDLGGGVRIRVIHTPGHTRGHCALHIEPDDVLFLADIDLSGFGPYYGDAWSDLASFERTLVMIREFDARYYATSHHIGVLDGREAFLERLDRFESAIERREQNLLAYLAEAHDLDEVAEHRFVYRKGAGGGFVTDVERRSMAQHLDRLERDGRVKQVEPGRYLAT